ncbi:Uncharacterised protein [Candidatus Bartonella washoeensis]|uniref:Phage related protein n=1 Tax=Candidatus Bartonella washoeensis Sb944nv TaxID=1094563 RepID=J0Q1N6_9HYPH|nr:hypothetical protein [Bartonella washoeensis]EJF78896.1 hypothetical protein MCQ_00937 [Bartonella washoeensis Sb944nv]SPU26556.1 Uncharacterised protein [Bartonella washoeensis]
MEKKYEFTDETTEVDSKTLRRIRALRNFGDVKKGDLGGYIEKEENLSHEGDCWVGDDAKVYEDARIYDNAHVSDYAKVFGNAEVYEDVHLYGFAEVYGDVRVFGDCDDICIGNDAGTYGHVDDTNLMSTGEKTR